MRKRKHRYKVNWKRVFEVFWPFFAAAALIIGVNVYKLVSPVLNERERAQEKALVNLHFGDINQRDIRVREQYKERFMVKTLSLAVFDNTIADQTDAGNIIFMDAQSGEILAGKNTDKKIYPASMTKIMTLITALDYIEDLDDTFTITRTITDNAFLAGATAAGFSAGEEVRIIDLLYGLMLPSGADASEAIAIYVAGSEDAFASLMNEKAKKIGLENSHFVNASGLHNDDHYSTVKDIALVTEYAMRSVICYKIMSSASYISTPTSYHPDGIEMFSTVFSRMTGLEAENAAILAGKTGFTNEAGQCLATYGESLVSKKKYVCVSSGGSDKWEAVYDAIDMFSYYAK